MTTEPPSRALLEALRALVASLEELRAPAMIIGGIAVIARGVDRLTRDADAAVWGADIDLDELLKTLATHQIVPRIPNILDFARQQQVLLLEHQPSGTLIEVSIAWLPFEREAMAKATRIHFSGVEILAATAEDLVIYKALAWRDRDRSDVERLIVLYGKSLDFDRIRDFVRQFAEVLEEPQRVQEFETVAQKALGTKGTHERLR